MNFTDGIIAELARDRVKRGILALSEYEILSSNKMTEGALIGCFMSALEEAYVLPELLAKLNIEHSFSKDDRILNDNDVPIIVWKFSDPANHRHFLKSHARKLNELTEELKKYLFDAAKLLGALS